MEEIRIICRNLEANDEIKNYINKKYQKIFKYIPKISSVEITIRKEKHDYKVDVLVHTYHKKVIKVSHRDGSLWSAIDVSLDKLKESLVKYKEKKVISNKKHFKKEIIYPVEPEIEDMVSYKKVNIRVEKMSEKEAVSKFKASGLDMLFFFNLDTNGFALIKKVNNEIEITDLQL